MNRRSFISGCLTCSAHVYGLAQFSPLLMRSFFQPQENAQIVAKEKWGRIEKLVDGVWCLISTPFESRDFTTVCNGGIIAGNNGVLAIESFMQPKGATWLAEKARELTGRWPTDIVSTHFHGDHTSGHRGYFVNRQKPRVWLTDETRKSAEKSFSDNNQQGNEFENVSTIELDTVTKIDLGNRQVRFVNRSGHTNSDVTIEITDPKVVWCGDLFFNRMFPNYGDAIPSKLDSYVDSIIATKDVIYVPGHGPIADRQAIENYKQLLQFVRESATSSFRAGKEIDESVKEFKLPESLSKWTIWSPDNAKRAYTAWYKELRSKPKID